MAEALLDVRGLSLALADMAMRPLFGKPPLRPILHEIDLTVARGECVALVGESGSGKTTLARTVLRLYEPQQGEIVFAGREVTHMGEVELRPLRARMQMIFQDPLSALNPRRRIGEIVVQPLLSYGALGPSPTRAALEHKAAALLEQVSLPAEFARRYPHELSGGQRQRVGIARAIALEPDLIVADEIVSGLDVSTQARILLLLRELRARLGMGMIFVTHDLSVVRVLCDRVVVMREGRILEHGPTESVFAHPQHPYTQALLDAIPLPEIDDDWLSSTHPVSLKKETATMKIQNAIALVTGANRGIGLELVQQLLAAGARKVYATARNTASLDALAKAHPGRLELLTLDITRAEQIDAAKARCTDVNLLVNNAGINRHQGFLSAGSLDDAQAEVTTNYLGTLAMCRAFAPQLDGNGAIVNMMSILAKVTIPGMGSLCAAKAAGLRMTEGVRAELAAKGTLVVAVMPGAVDTEMSKDFQGPMSSPAEVAKAVLAGLENGDEEVYVGDFAGWINAGMKDDPKVIERELAKYLPG
ncbi:SDR family NAD(P)-dependent oxidoreductase [Variovorax sp. dw_954]|uniref:SDR family NAD(P)-dependent oxidoreductase n=1 Tax=Variovorax sp. dw_954 TaxID=2720078 RepID=UPI001BD5CA30|nr:SDR family NAD(P)-dependent oxidoreductase [Variovorax sp. dw_954]